MQDFVISPPTWQQQLQQWQQLGILRALDVALIEMLAQQLSAAKLASPAEGRHWLWLALASSQLMQGHVCLDLAQAFVKPASLLANHQRSGKALAQMQQFVVEQSLVEVTTLLQQLPALVGSADALPQGVVETPFMLQQQRLYLYRYWHYEQQISRYLQHSFERTRALRQQLDPAAIAPLVQALFTTAADSTDWQAVACTLALGSHFAVITGGPGTGKTTTVVKLLLLLQQWSLQQRGKTLAIALAAPTGKAAARLSGSVTAALQKLAISPNISAAAQQAVPTTAQTLHRLLGCHPDGGQSRYHADAPLPLDVLVVDEASMVDVGLFAAMLAALPAQARLVLLGDKDQLASVEAGAVMAELCRDAEAGGYQQLTADWLQQISGQTIANHYLRADADALDQQVVMLRTSHRFNAHSGIGQLASAVNRADATTALHILAQPTADLAWLQCEVQSPQFAQLVLHGDLQHSGGRGFMAYLQLVQQAPDREADDAEFQRWAEQVLQQFASFQLLAAVRQGPYGVEQLNQRIAQILLRERLIPRTEGWYPGRPVMVVQNDYSTGLMNGDVGICLPRAQHINGEWQTNLRVVFAGTHAGQSLRWLLPSRLPQVETVYAMTVHKSQGSEFAHAVLVLPEQSSALLTKELIYTGITRAARQFSLLCLHSAVLNQAICQKTERSGGIRLQIGMNDI